MRIKLPYIGIEHRVTGDLVVESSRQSGDSGFFVVSLNYVSQRFTIFYVIIERLSLLKQFKLRRMESIVAVNRCSYIIVPRYSFTPLSCFIPVAAYRLWFEFKFYPKRESGR